MILLNIKVKDGPVIQRYCATRMEAQELIDSLRIEEKIDAEQWSDLFDQLSKESLRKATYGRAD